MEGTRAKKIFGKRGDQPGTIIYSQELHMSYISIDSNFDVDYEYAHYVGMATNILSYIPIFPLLTWVIFLISHPNPI